MHTRFIKARHRTALGAACALASLATVGTASSNEFFVGYASTLIELGSTAGDDLTTLVTGLATPIEMVMEGDDLLVATAEGFLMRFERATGNFLYDYDIGIVVNGMAIHNGTTLIGATDGDIHRFNIQTGLEIEVLHPLFPVNNVQVVGDRVYSGSSTGQVEFSEIGQDNWTLLGTAAPGAVLDLQFAGDSFFAVGSGSTSIFERDAETTALISQFDVGERPTDLELDGTDLLIATEAGTVYVYDILAGSVVRSFEVELPVLSMVVHPTEPVGQPFCPGRACPCGNDSPTGGCANSTGEGARLEGSGTANLAMGDLNLVARSLPPGSFGVLFMSQGSTSISFGDGKLCALGGGNQAFRFPVQNSGPAGLLEEIGVAAHAQDNFPAGGQIVAGSTWNFQAWYRDLSGPCQSGFNTSNAWSVSFAE